MSHDLRHPQSDPVLPSFQEILDELEKLSHEHLLFYRVQVGQLFLRHFWNDDPTEFSSKNPHKINRLTLFFAENSEALRRYGLSHRQAQRSIRAYIVVRSLPVALTQQLFLSQVLELARLTDPSQRTEVANAAIEENWSLIQLRDAISAVQAGLSFDEDPNAPGSQIPKTTPTQRKPVPGRLVTRAERMLEDMGVWTEQWTQVDASRLRRPQRQRLQAAVAGLEAQVVALRAALGEAGGS